MRGHGWDDPTVPAETLLPLLGFPQVALCVVLLGCVILGSFEIILCSLQKLYLCCCSHEAVRKWLSMDLLFFLKNGHSSKQPTLSMWVSTWHIILQAQIPEKDITLSCYQGRCERNQQSRQELILQRMRAQAGCSEEVRAKEKEEAILFKLV